MKILKGQNSCYYIADDIGGDMNEWEIDIEVDEEDSQSSHNIDVNEWKMRGITTPHFFLIKY